MRPEVELHNFQNVYEYYADREVNTHLAAAMHVATALLYHPRVTYAAGAEPFVRDHIEAGGRLILTSNHINMFDQLPIAAHMLRSPTLRPMVGNTVVWAKQPYFTKGWLRPALDGVGGIPVWRAQDTPGKMPRSERIGLADGLFEATALRMARGAHLFMFPEGTRNRGELATLGKIQAGLGRVAVLAAKRINEHDHHNLPKVLVVPTALWYGDDKPKGSLRPRIHVGSPILVSRHHMPVTVTQRLSHAMAESLDYARRTS